MIPNYIDKDALLQDIQERFNIVCDSIGYQFGYDLAITRIKNAPVADVQEVKRGKWIEQVKIRKDGEARLVHWQCSLCGCFLATNTANYCPNCGAKMDSDEEKNNEQN